MGEGWLSFGVESVAWTPKRGVGLGRETKKRSLVRTGRLVSLGPAAPSMKKPTADERKHQCTRKRRYRSQGDALDAALIAGTERQRKAYLCPICRHWHLSSA